MPASLSGDFLELCRKELETVAADANLAVSDRQRRLLYFIGTEVIEGRGDRLKAYTIALNVLDRSQDFDPQTDSIVRVEMGRLRRALELYYALDARRSPIEITIPKGTYRPVFNSSDRADRTESAIEPEMNVPRPETLRPTARRSSVRAAAATGIAVVAVSGLLAFLFLRTGGDRQTEPVAPRLQTGTVSTAASARQLIVVPVRFDAEGKPNSLASHLLHVRLTERIARMLPDYHVTADDRADDTGDVDLVLRTTIRLRENGATVSFIVINADASDFVTRGFFRIKPTFRVGAAVSEGIIEGVAQRVFAALKNPGS
ncbi:MAG: hypothetical protein ACRCTI_01385 [Beijerinckiaceae bacterium]